MTRKHRFAFLFPAAVIAAAAFVPGSVAQSGDKTMRLEMRHKEAQVRLVDLPPKMTRKSPSESPGDLVVGSGRLRNAAGAVVGRAHQSFTVTGGKGKATTELVTATFSLADGQLTLQGLSDNGTKDPLVLVITGGTGAYAGARGTVAIIEESERAVVFEARFV